METWEDVWRGTRRMKVRKVVELYPHLAHHHVPSVTGIDPYPIHYAVAVDDIEFIDYLLGLGVDVNVRNGFGSLALGIVRSVEAFERLIRAGADVNATNIHGRTMLHEYCMRERSDLIRLLMHMGMPHNPLDHLRKTPYDYVVDYEFKIDADVMEYVRDGVVPIRNVKRALRFDERVKRASSGV